MALEIELLILSAVFVLIRTFLILGGASEEIFHINMSNLIRRKKVFLNGKNDVFVPKGRLSNPILYHFIISCIPEFFCSSKGLRVINSLFDYVMILSVYFYLGQMFPQNIVTIAEVDFGFSFVVAAMLTFCPALTPLNSRTRGGGARTMGLLLCFAYFISLYEFSLNNSISFGGLSVVLVFLLLYSGQFGHQVAIFGTLALTLLTLEVRYLIPVSIYALICSFVSRDLRAFFWCKFLAHYRYYTSIMSGTLVEDRKKNPLNLPLYPSSLRYDRTKIRKFIYLSPIYFIPVLYSLSFVSLFFLSQSESVFIKYTLLVNLSLVVVAFLTFWYPISVFGQSERYLEYSTPFAFIGSVYHIGNEKYIIYIILFNLIFCSFHLFLLNYKNNNQSKNSLKNEEKLFINRLGNTVLLVSPYKRTFNCLDMASCKTNIFLPLINTKSRSNWNENYDLFNQYSHYKSDWVKWNQEYGITHLLVQNDKHNKFPQDFNDLSLLKRFTNYYLYEIN